MCTNEKHTSIATGAGSAGKRKHTGSTRAFDQPPRDRPSGDQAKSDALVIRVVVAVVALLMAYSVVWWLIGFTEAAAVAAIGACGLAVDIVRRLLASFNSTRSMRRRTPK